MTPAGPRSGEGAAPRGRPFFRAGRAGLLAAAAASAGVLALARPAAATGSLIAGGAPGQARVELLECGTGRLAGRKVLEAQLAAPPVLAADGSAVYAATVSSELLRLAVPTLATAARVALAHRPAALAAGSGPDAILLAGGKGDEPLSAHDPVTLAELARYRHRDGKTATVSALMDNPGRSALVAGFDDLPETWEIVYDRAAPPVLLGFVHDYRNNEAVPLPGRLTARPFVVASPTRAFAPGPLPWELARIDGQGALGVINLEVRREIERPAVPPPGGPDRVAAWRAPAGETAGETAGKTAGETAGKTAGEPSGKAAARPRPGGVRGWVAAAPGSSTLVPMRAVGWRPLPPIELGGEVLALASEPWGARVLVAHRGREGIVVSAVDPSDGAVTRVSELQATQGERSAPAQGERPTQPERGIGAKVEARDTGATLRFVPGSGARCVALMDAAGNWLGSVSAPGPGTGPGGALPALSR